MGGAEGWDPDAPATGGGLFGLASTADASAVVVVGVPFEATTSFGRGTAGAPAAVLEASWQVDLHDLDTGEPWEAGIHMLPVDPRFQTLNDEACALSLPIIAAGGVDEHGSLPRINAIGAEVNAMVHAATAAILARGAIPGVLGGDHSVPFGAIQAAAERHPGLGILHIDAHADLRDAYEGFTWSHASILRNVLTKIPGIGPVCQVGLRDVGRAEHTFAEAEDRVFWFTERWLFGAGSEGEPWTTVCHRILAALPDKVWVTFDIDGLDPSLCPNTGTPVPGGLQWREAMTLLALLVDSGRQIVGFDLVEVGAQAWDANVGARVLYKLAGHAINSRG